MNQSFIFLADGFETIEATTPVDVLRRAGIPVKTVSITDSPVVTSVQGVPVTADCIFDSLTIENPEWLILPGGMPGAENLYKFAPLHELLKCQMQSAKGRIAAICASPGVVLGQLGLLKGHEATCYPGFERYLEGAAYIDSPVVCSGKFVLANGPSNALLWSLAIVRAALGEDAADKIACDMLLYTRTNETDNFFG